MKDIASVAIVGAGMAGLACAAALVEAGLTVSLFDKGRRPGGRIATRRADGLLFDHGAQYATAHDLDFGSIVEAMVAAGAAAPWREVPTQGGSARWVGTPGMSAIPRFIADNLIAAGTTLATERHVAYLHHDETGWHVRHMPAAETRPGTVTGNGGALAGPFDAVVVALPSAQAAPLIRPLDPVTADRVEACTIAPCWATMAAFAERVEAPDAQRRIDGPLAWIARDSSRPGRTKLPDTWMLHASPGWTRANLERPAPDVAADLLAAFKGTLAAPPPAPLHLSAHRWRYALVETPLGQPCLWNSPTRIGLCGDWCIGPRVEAAYLSGAALASVVCGGT